MYFFLYEFSAVSNSLSEKQEAANTDHGLYYHCDDTAMYVFSAKELLKIS